MNTFLGSLAGLIAVAGHASAQTDNVWIGGPSGSWFEASNWSLQRIPGPADRAIIDTPLMDSRAVINGTAEVHSVDIGVQDEPNAQVFGDEILLNNGTLITSGSNTLDGTIRSGSGTDEGENTVRGGVWTGQGGIVFAGGASQRLILRQVEWGVENVNVAADRSLVMWNSTIQEGAVIQAVLPGSSLELSGVTGAGEIIVGSTLQGPFGDNAFVRGSMRVTLLGGAEAGAIGVQESSVLRVAGGDGPPDDVVLQFALEVDSPATIVVESGQSLVIGDPPYLGDLTIDGHFVLERDATVAINDGLFMSRDGILRVPLVSESAPIVVDGAATFRTGSEVHLTDVDGFARRPVIEAGLISTVLPELSGPLPAGFTAQWDRELSLDGTTLFAVVRCLADVNADGVVSPSDFNAWVIAFNFGTPACDQNGDGACLPNDFNAWILNYNTGC
ncbi:MAG: GC-type dockerin domain-anchored protein [Planctomycetota bacterium]